MWMVGRSAQSASLRLSPAELGPIEIRLSLQQEQASVAFTAQHALTREALEAAIPRLREMFNESNLQLVNVDVSQRDGSGQRGLTDPHAHQEGEGSDQAGNDATPDGVDPDTGQQLVERHGIGLLDDYA